MSKEQSRTPCRCPETCNFSEGQAKRTGGGNGGGGRDRTDDLKLAKLPLSQLSYAPGIFQPVHECDCHVRALIAVSNHQDPT